MEVSFPWGMYHATAWNRSANEGVAEWPPAPWRILRALFSAWKVHSPELSEADVMSVLESLSVLPSFVLPPIREAHTRHYMPGVRHFEGAGTDTAKTLDAFVVAERDACLWIEWPVVLTDGQRSLLATLADGIRYLGRGESLVECRLAEVPGSGVVSSPVEEGAERDSVRVLVSDGPSSVATLAQTTRDVRAARRLLPDRTRLQAYSRPEAMAAPRRRVALAQRSVEAVRFAIGGSPRPSRFDIVGLGDLVHRAAIRRHRIDSPTLSGLDGEGVPLRGAHRHAHYLSLPEREDLSGGRVGSIVVWAPGGFLDSEVSALADLVELRSSRLDGALSRPVMITGSGTIEELGPDIATPSSVWESITPYSPVRHHKGELVEQLLADVNLELAHRDRPLAAAVELIPGSWLHYGRYRPGRERLQQQRHAYGLRLEFDDPVVGPLALGQLSHFGLGLFRPIPEA